MLISVLLLLYRLITEQSNMKSTRMNCQIYLYNMLFNTTLCFISFLVFVLV